MAQPNPSGRLYFLDVGISTPELNGRILTCHPDGSNLRELVTQIKTMPDGIAVDAGRQHIYWTNMGVPSANDGSIQRCDLSGKDIVTIVPKGITHTPKQLTIAPKSGKLYWSDREGTRIMRANMDGSDVEVLYRPGTTEDGKHPCEDWCVGIAVDEESGCIYWSQKGPSKGNKGRIFRMGLETKAGESAEQRTDVECLLDNLPEPIDLELDHRSRRLFWTDRGDPPYGNTVNVIALDKLPVARSRPDIMVRKLHEGIGIALDLRNDRMFFGDLGGSLYSSNLDGSCKNTIFPDIGGAITGVSYAEE
ncbi:YWTD domain-containing protein [Aspergillus undulatus]|uniref:YWTD domain-containing protein n=1 Tax=Aspergillus undulatus TaxID=1810928 RepID=UPI003CCCC49C